MSDSESELTQDSSQSADMNLSTLEQEKEAVRHRAPRESAGFHFDQTQQQLISLISMTPSPRDKVAIREISLCVV